MLPPITSDRKVQVLILQLQLISFIIHYFYCNVLIFYTKTFFPNILKPGVNESDILARP